MSRVWRHTGRASREHRITCAASVITSVITEPEPAIIHFKNTRKSGFACITLLSRAIPSRCSRYDKGHGLFDSGIHSEGRSPLYYIVRLGIRPFSRREIHICFAIRTSPILGNRICSCMKGMSCVSNTLSAAFLNRTERPSQESMP